MCVYFSLLSFLLRFSDEWDGYDGMGMLEIYGNFIVFFFKRLIDGLMDGLEMKANLRI
jgi:hypothetical protein